MYRKIKTVKSALFMYGTNKKSVKSVFFLYGINKNL